MAKSSKSEKLDYAAQVRRLKSGGPDRLYLLWGEEDYLRERFFDEVKTLCLDGVSDDFNYKRLDGPVIDLGRLSDSINALPLLSERTLVEVRDFDINKCAEGQADVLKRLISDIPDYCTVVFAFSAQYSPDGRLSAVKTIKKLGTAIEFTPQGQSALINWITRRFSDYGKNIGKSDAEYLVFACGSLMNRLIPEIEKAANYASGETVTRADIDAVVMRMPEADVFEMTDFLARREFDSAARVMAQLLAAKEHPIMLNAMIGQQMRRLCAARLALDAGKDKDYVGRLLDIKYGFIIDRLVSGARGFTTARLKDAVELCAEYDYAMKSTGASGEELIKELLLRLAVGS